MQARCHPAQHGCSGWRRRGSGMPTLRKRAQVPLAARGKSGKSGGRLRFAGVLVIHSGRPNCTLFEARTRARADGLRPKLRTYRSSFGAHFHDLAVDGAVSHKARWGLLEIHRHKRSLGLRRPDVIGHTRRFIAPNANSSFDQLTPRLAVRCQGCKVNFCNQAQLGQLGADAPPLFDRVLGEPARR